MESFCDINKLAELLNPKKNACSDSEEGSDSGASNNQVAPGKRSKRTNAYAPLRRSEEQRDVLDPEDDSQFYRVDDLEASDWRKCPQWEISYRQQVTPSDVFLQMSGKTPATASCEDMIVSVYLPGEKYKNIDLKITKERLDLLSPKYKLGIPLPHPVDSQRGDAKWDNSTEKLAVTLRMDREFDFVNF